MANSNISSVTSALQTVANVLLVSPQSTIGYQPQGSPTLPALLFHYEGEQSVVLRSDITDHFAEDNTALQNQIALPPPLIRTHGFIGELNDIPPNKVLQLAFVAAQKLTALSGYSPVLSVTALEAYNNALLVYQTAASLLNSAVSTYASITGTDGESVIDGSGFLTTQPNQTVQQQYFQQFYGYWATRTLFTVQTPWAVFKNMAIELCQPVQAGDSKDVTDFEVTFKQIRFATNASTAGQYLNATVFGGRLATQAATTTALGTSALTPSNTTFASLLGL